MKETRLIFMGVEEPAPAEAPETGVEGGDEVADAQGALDDAGKEVQDLENQARALFDKIVSESKDKLVKILDVGTYTKGDWVEINKQLEEGLGVDRATIKAMQKFLHVKPYDGKMGPKTINALAAAYNLGITVTRGVAEADESGEEEMTNEEVLAKIDSYKEVGLKGVFKGRYDLILAEIAPVTASAEGWTGKEAELRKYLDAVQTVVLLFRSTENLEKTIVGVEEKMAGFIDKEGLDLVETVKGGIKAMLESNPAELSKPEVIAKFQRDIDDWQEKIEAVYQAASKKKQEAEVADSGQ